MITFTSTIWTRISRRISFNLHFFPLTSTSKQSVPLICLLIFFLYLSLQSALTEQLQLSIFICFLLLARKSKSTRTHVFKVCISIPIKVWFNHLSFIQKMTLKKQILIFLKVGFFIIVLSLYSLTPTTLSGVYILKFHAYHKVSLECYSIIV